MQILDVQEIGGFTPKMLRLSARGLNGVVYSFDVPEAFYNFIAPGLGLPPIPAESEG